MTHILNLQLQMLVCYLLKKFPTSLSILILFACILPYTTTDFLSWDSCNELYENNTFI